MTPYFKVKIGYGVEDFISISKDELEKALYAFRTNDKVMFENGVTSGKHILSITPDYYKTMGWNYGHKMEDLDFAEVKAKVGDPVKLIAQAKENVSHYISSGKESLIGTKTLEIESKKALQIEGKKELLDNMKIK